MKMLPLAAALAVLVLPVAGQQMRTPAGEAPGPWLLGTVGVGPQPWQVKKVAGGPEPSPELPPGSQIALKGLAIKVGVNGEAAVAYDLDLCRMIGAWVGGKFVTPMNLMSRGEYPTALGEVAFTTGEIPGFLLGKEAAPLAAGEAPVPSGGAPISPEGSAPARGGVVPANGGVVPPQGGAPAPDGGALARREGVVPPKGGVVPGNGGAPLPNGGTPGRDGGAPAPRAGALAPSGEGLALQRDASVAQSNPAVSQSNPATGWTDPRAEPFGPLPEGQARFKGFYVNGGKTILKWDIGGVEVLEMPGCFVRDEEVCFTRTFRLAPSLTSIAVAIAANPGANGSEGALSPVGDTGELFQIDDPNGASQAVVEAMPKDSIWWQEAGQVFLKIPPRTSPCTFRVTVVRMSKERQAHGATLVPEVAALADLMALTKGGPARWPERVTTAGEVSAKTDEAYVVDTIRLPDPNPWGAPMFVGGFDFFPDGRAAVCTFHGDVFVVSGIDAKLEQVTWRRFASGLYHALGLKIVNGEIFVTCRDGLWRLKDLNGDGECDFYEAFNFDLKATRNFHEFVFDLQTDPAGNFYFAKGGPVKNGGRGFDEIMAHHGAMFRVTPDGGKLEVIATGFRAPNGIGVGPRGELTSGDNEGTWVPACKINWITPGSFHGVVDLAHRAVPPTDYDRPLCWLPKRVDNSGGGQVWVPPGDRWGPWGGQMLHLSYGQSALYGVLKEEAGGFTQGGVVKFPLQFQSGIMRGRFHPVDGQLYVAGLRGWQTNGLKNGAFQRVRYTGAVPRMPVAMRVKQDGIELTFACSLDTQAAADPDSWSVEQWRYLWSGAYGSPELSTIEPVEAPAEAGKQGEAQFSKTQIAQKKHDPVTVKSVSIGTDDRTVFLEIPGLKPVMQMAIKYDLKTSTGEDLRGEVVHTIHALGAD